MRVYRGIKDAFPKAVIAEITGVHQETRPDPPYALISISYAETLDGRVVFVTQLGEMVDLSNRSLKHTSNSVELVQLSVPTSEEDVGDVVLVGFGSKPTDFGRFQAMCEGIILKPAQGAQVQTKGVIASMVNCSLIRGAEISALFSKQILLN